MTPQSITHPQLSLELQVHTGTLNTPSNKSHYPPSPQTSSPVNFLSINIFAFHPVRNLHSNLHYTTRSPPPGNEHFQSTLPLNILHPSTSPHYRCHYTYADHHQLLFKSLQQPPNQSPALSLNCLQSGLHTRPKMIFLKILFNSFHPFLFL